MDKIMFVKKRLHMNKGGGSWNIMTRSLINAGGNDPLVVALSLNANNLVAIFFSKLK
jgi:hypothetical protein